MKKEFVKVACSYCTSHRINFIEIYELRELNKNYWSYEFTHTGLLKAKCWRCVNRTINDDKINL